MLGCLRRLSLHAFIHIILLKTVRQSVRFCVEAVGGMLLEEGNHDCSFLQCFVHHFLESRRELHLL